MKDKVRIRMLFLHEYRQVESDLATVKFFKNCMMQFIIGLILALALMVAGDIKGFMAVLICLLPLSIPFIQFRRLDTKIAAIKLQLLLELPIFVNKLLLLLQAGQTLQNAIIQCADGYLERSEGHPFATQMKVVSNQLRHGYSFARVIEDLARRCGTQEVTFFTSAVLMNYRRGGDELVASLRSLSRDLWEKRKTAVKTLGEEASAKMIFPLILIFITVMITVGAPAVMQLN